jgi:transcriptional antiterminator NusG
MIFVRVDTEEQRIVITQPSVIRYLVLRGEHSPTVIPDEQMEKFRFMLDFSDKPIDFNTENFVPGEKVKVIKGPLIGLEGELVNVEGKSIIAIRIDQLGCAIVEMSRSMVEKLDSQ